MPSSRSLPDCWGPELVELREEKWNPVLGRTYQRREDDSDICRDRSTFGQLPRQEYAILIRAICRL
jgi:hypothetical protein